MILVYLIVGCVLLGLTYLWAKAFYLFFKAIFQLTFFSKRNHENSNPYIKTQLLINQNNKNYDEYLKWMGKNGGGVPIEKVMTKEEFEAEQKLKRLIS